MPPPRQPEVRAEGVPKPTRASEVVVDEKLGEDREMGGCHGAMTWGSPMEAPNHP